MAFVSGFHSTADDRSAMASRVSRLRACPALARTVIGGAVDRVLRVILVAQQHCSNVR